MNRLTKYILGGAALLVTLTSCEHKELCFDHEDHAMSSRADVKSEWEFEWEYTYPGGTDWRTEWDESYFGMTYPSLLPSMPEGFRAVVYNADGSNDMANLPPTGGEMFMRPGEHSILFYNNDTEYIVFEGLDKFATAQATTRTRSRSSYMGTPFNQPGTSKAENTVNPPDVLYGHYIPFYEAEKSYEPIPLDVPMRPLVFTYLVRYEFKQGLRHVKSARGALSGMAASVYLNSGTTSTETATILYDCTVQSFGPQAIVRSFGIPGFPNDHYSRADMNYGLNLEVLLNNGKTLSLNFDVTDQVAKQPRGGVIIVSDIVITDEQAASASGSGFEVDVTDWGDDIDVPMEF